MTSKEHPTATITPPKPTPGQSGRFGSEQVVAFSRNRWPLSSECADSFLIMDVNPNRAPWVWVRSGDLIAAMRTFDTVENRGYLLVSEVE